jgi:squalene-associated FAD-dependent desaturase
MKVAVIGGGYAGMAAAVTLAEAGAAVTVFEAGPHLGGRARRVIVNGVALDNGLHILIGAYRETLRLVQALHAEPSQALARLPLDWRIHRRFHLKTAPLPAPLHLALALVTARGAPWHERLAAARFMRAMRLHEFRLDSDTTVSALLAIHGQGPAFVRYLWEPLCVAALNTPPSKASAQVFLNVIRDALGASREAGEILLARVDLSALLPEPAAAYVRARGGEVVTSRTVETIELQSDGVLLRSRGGGAHYDHAICAVSPHRAAALLSGFPELASTTAALERFSYQPIYSVYFQFEESIRLPGPMLGLQGIAQWAFDREALCGQRGLIGAVISAEGRHEQLTQEALAREVHAQLELELGPLPALSWHRVIAEKRATFECTVGLQRPGTRTALPNIHLAGDYTASDYPATLECAVRSGIAAATQIVDAASKL